VIGKVPSSMVLTKVEIRFGMGEFHMLVVIFFTIVVTDPVPLECQWGPLLPY